MRKAAVTTVATVAGVILLLSLKPHQNPAPGMTASPPSSAPTGHKPSSSGDSGTYSGSVINTSYGPVQVSVTLAHGRITAVKALRTPSDRPRSQQIAADAVPRLTREALSAQSAHIDAVSGATYTSEGYARSLQSALDQAGV
ncbi:FMN-binding protein [Streptomyces rhizosphaericus]|uniref:FMN-binding protein n=1 Tax=Streptomyces rhizosphaericus TaxID=114699 RepID=A0A6G4ACG6_9ACTN|nr:FMN-binding protein [Streptomyces rhizosphaericus]NEW70908.1 FMN-binding protein [Streptomyces rhizosphaericus]